MKKDNLFEREIAENEAWFNGSSTVLENFFKIERPKYEVVKMFDNKPTFWNSVSGDVPRVHSGLPALISKTWVRLINPRDVEITINNEAAQERWNAIAKDNRFYTRIMPQLIVTMSWGGYAVLKLSRDDKGDIIEVVNPKYARVKEERGRIVGYDFEIYENGLVIVEHYEPGRVWYEAFEEVQNRRTKVPVPE
ncbi:MAG: hypothetical protein GX025_10150, partial [Clostridiales bacterium]|nr:hypothetical protein [Clostridiales bacterium]